MCRWHAEKDARSKFNGKRKDLFRCVEICKQQRQQLVLLLGKVLPQRRVDLLDFALECTERISRVNILPDRCCRYQRDELFEQPLLQGLRQAS